VAIFDLAKRAIVLKVVYYGCALGGKTTNLITLHRLTDPEGRQGLISIATKNDRTLFFDLLPVELGQIGGLTVHVKLYTVPGQVHYEVTRRQVLSAADGVVLVVDSDPKMGQANTWAWENLLHNLKTNGLDPKVVPIVMQWNKRDLPETVPVAELEVDLNPRELPSFEAVATVGTGVVETFEAVVTRAIGAAYTKSGKTPPPQAEVASIVAEALAPAKTHVGPVPSDSANAKDFEHRFDSEAYRDDWAEKGRDRQIVDQETLLSEAVQTGMELAERLDGMHSAQQAGQRRVLMMGALARLASGLVEPDGPALPSALMSQLLESCARKRGSLLLFKRGQSSMEEREVVPPGRDPLNQAVSPSIGSAAHRLCQGTEPRLVEDLVNEVFFAANPPGAENLVSCLLSPVCCDGAKFGALVAYGAVDESPFDEGEREFWRTASLMTALSLHWRGLRRKLGRAAETAPDQPLT